MLSNVTVTVCPGGLGFGRVCRGFFVCPKTVRYWGLTLDIGGYKIGGMTNTTCPATVDGQHDIAWMDVPEMHHDAGQNSFTVPSCERGICLNCDERFIR